MATSHPAGSREKSGRRGGPASTAPAGFPRCTRRTYRIRFQALTFIMALLLIRFFEAGVTSGPKHLLPVTVSRPVVQPVVSSTVVGATAVHLPPDRGLAILEAGYRRPDSIQVVR